MKVRSLAYVGIGAPSPLLWLSFCTNILGMMPARAAPGEDWGVANATGIAQDGTVYLKMDERQWRIAVHPSCRNGELLYLGLELDGCLELKAAVQELQALNIDVRLGSRAECEARAVTGLAFTKDPSGNTLELFYGQTFDYNFRSPVADHGFVAGSLGIGHLNLLVTEQAACYDFYTAVLGFRLSDYYHIDNETKLQFLRCNERHHSIAIVDLGGVRGIQHMLVELCDIDAVGRALDRAKSAGFEIVSTMGRHRNDRMLSFYLRGPSGFDIEIGCGGLQVDENWRPNQFCEGDVWGHDGLLEAVQSSVKNIQL